MSGSDVTVEQLKKVAEGREAEMFEWGEGRILRLFRPGHSVEETVRQITLMEEAGRAGVPVPRTFEQVTISGRTGFVMERLDGPDLLTLIGTKPWSVFHVAGVCGHVHARINSATAPALLESTHERLRRRLTKVSPDVIPPAFAEAALASLDRLPEGDRLCHGDFHPANVLKRDGEPVVIDWSNATRGPAESDFARARVVIRIGEPPPGTSPVLMFLTRYFRKLYLTLYSRAYRKAIAVDERLVAEWEIPVAISRLGEIAEERQALMRYIESRLNE